METMRPPSTVVMLASGSLHAAPPPADMLTEASVYAYPPLSCRYACPENAAEARTAESTGIRLSTVAPPEFPQTSPMTTGTRNVTEDADAETTPLPVSTMRASDIS